MATATAYGQTGVDVDWLAERVHDHGGVVAIADNAKAQTQLISLAIRYVGTVTAQMQSMIGRPAPITFRSPHHTISSIAMRDEVRQNRDGLLMLDELQEFKKPVIQAAADELGVPAHGRPWTMGVLGIGRLRDEGPTADAIVQRASILQLPVVYVWPDLIVRDYAPSPAMAHAASVQTLVDEINAHRRQIGQRPLDPVAAGWSEDDVRIEHARIAALNPADIRAMLLSW